MKNSRQIIVESSVGNLHKVEQFVEYIADEFNISNTYFGNVLIAVTEAVINAIEHGNNKEQSKKVLVEFGQEPRGLVFKISDEGKGFDFASIPDPTDITQTTQNIGRGLFLMKSLADEMKFENNGTSVELVFYVSSINSELSLRRIEQLKIYSKALLTKTELN